jgi:hypothetical protein
MADNDKAAAPKPRAMSRTKPNSVAVDDKAPDKIATPEEKTLQPETIGPAVGDLTAAEATKRAKPLSVEAGDLPDAVRKRYYTDKAKWSGEPAFFTSAEMKDPAFRDQGRRLVTATESQEVVKDLVAIAQHRGWERIHVTGTEAFRRAVWLEAAQKGLEVKGYKPSDRDLQELDRVRGDASKNTIAPSTARDAAELRHPGTASNGTRERVTETGGRGDGRSLPNDRAVDSQLRVMEAVIRRSLFDNPEAVKRVMTVARAQLDAHVAAGRTIRPAVVRETGQAIQRGADRSSGPVRSTGVPQGRDHKAPERSRSR